MAHNPQAPQGPEGNHDPAGSTQMFRAYVHDGPQQGGGPAAAPAGASGGGPRVGLVVGVIVVVAVVAAVAWLALG